MAPTFVPLPVTFTISSGALLTVLFDLSGG
jgi:hypothetical protein